MANSDPGSFGKFVPGFDFLQNLARQAGGGSSPGVASGTPPLGQWVAPTFSVEELDKRIEELKAVQFWLDQNARALAATIQALEVQRMTLATLQGMNVSLGDVAQAVNASAAEALSSFSAFGGRSSSAAPSPPVASSPEPGRAVPAPAPQTPFAGLEIPPRRAVGGSEPPASDPVVSSGPESAEEASSVPPVPSAEPQAAEPAPASAAPAMPGLDPVGWWGALSQQFQAIASQALHDAAQHAATSRTPAAPAVPRTVAAAAPARSKSSKAKGAARTDQPAHAAPAQGAPSKPPVTRASAPKKTGVSAPAPKAPTRRTATAPVPSGRASRSAANNAVPAPSRSRTSPAAAPPVPVKRAPSAGRSRRP